MKSLSPSNKSKTTLRVIPLLLVVISMACSLPGLFGRGDATPENLGSAQPSPPVVLPTALPTQPMPTPHPQPPDIVESDPLPGAELPLDGPLTLYFNQPMQRASVEAALSLAPTQAGSLTWQDDATLVINPSRSLSPESEVVVTLDTGAKAVNGLALLQPVSLKYRTAGYLHMAQALPEPGAYDVDPSSAVVVTFNRPVVPLGGDPAQGPAAFSLEPQPQGRSEWINTSTYAFYPDPPLEGGRTYTIRLNEDLRSLDGSPLESLDEPLRPANEWSFITASPRVASVAPGPALGPLALDATLVITFNQSMDPLSVESNISLLQDGKIPVPGSVSWDERFTRLVFEPDDLLARDTAYTLRLEKQALARGGTPLSEPLGLEYNSVPELAVASSDPAPGGVKQFYQSVILTLTTPIQDDDLKRYVSVEPQIPNFGVYWNPYDRQMYVDGSYTPGESYTLRVSPELVDVWGSRLGREYTLNFTNANLPPGIMLTNPSEAMFLTVQDSSFSAQVTNFSTLNISLGSLPLQDFISMISAENSYETRRSYRPADSRIWQQSVDVPFNQTQAVDVFVSPDQTTLQPGLYYMRFNDLPQDVFIDPFLLVVSDVQVTFKMGATDVLVWTADLDGITPLANLPVTVYDGKGMALASGETDERGVFYSSISPIQDPYTTFYAVISQPGQADFGMALSSWSQGINPWDFNMVGDIQPPQLKGYFYTDRPIYRPGQTVYFRAILRQAFNARYEMPEISSLPLVLYYEYDQEVARFDLPLSEFGTLNGEYSLPVDARLGNYRLTADLPDLRIPLEVYFRVTEYRKPEIEVQVQFDADQVLASQNLTAAVEANYYFGAPASDLPVEWTLTANDLPFDLPGYQVGVDDLRWMSAFPLFFPFGRFVEQGQARTDAQGRLVLELDPGEVELRQRYTLEVTLQDETGQRISGRDTIDVNPAEFYIGIRPDAWVGRSGDAFGFDVLVADWESQPAGARALEADFRKVVWERQEPPASDIFGEPRFVPTYTPVDSTQVTTDEDGQARLTFTPPEPGTYQLDVSGDGARTSLILWVGGPGQAIWPNLPNDRLRLTADQKSYLPGETANLFVPNPFGQSALGLLAVERGIVLRYDVFELPPGGDALDIPLTGQDAPNVYISVTLLGRGQNGSPDFRQGYLDLPVEPVEQTFDVQLESQPQQAGPGEEVTLSLQVTDAAGSPVQGEFSLSVVDKAVLALADPNAPDITQAFYGEQILGIRTGVTLAAYAGRKIYQPGGGGGGGGEELSPFVRQQFEDTAYWNAEILTDPQGRAQVSLSLPDNLTTWQLLARGVAEDTRVGQEKSDLLTTKDLLVRPVVPRFLVAGDHVQLAAIVQNNSGTDMDVDVSLQANGMTLDDPASASQVVFVTAGGREQLEWWAQVEDVSSVDLVFSAASGELADGARPANGQLPVLRYTAPQTFSSAGLMEESGERLELVSLPRSFDPSGGTLNLELAPSLAGAMFSALDVLEARTYGSTEETLSSFLPNLETYRVLQDFSVTTPDLQARLDRTLEDGLKTLLALQNSDGGWGWWPGSESDPYISAYVLFGLTRVREAGAVVEEKVSQRMIDYLLGTLYTPSMTSETWQLDRLAFTQFALTQAGVEDLAGAQALFDVRDQLNPWAQALLALILEQLSPGGQATRTLFSDLESTAIRTASGVHWDEETPGWQNMTTPLSTTAMVVYALAQRDPGTPLLADAVRYLMLQRGPDGAWDSSYATAWSLMALSQVIKGTGEISGSYDFSASLNSLPVASGQAGIEAGPVQVSVPVSQLYPQDPNALLIQRGQGTGRLYYLMALGISRPVQEVAPLQRGINLARSYFPVEVGCSDGDCAPLHGAAAGELVEVRLTLTLEQAAYYLLVEDYLPAGAEVVNTSLKTAQQVIPELVPPEPEPLFDPRNPFGDGWGNWYFSEPRIHDERIAWSADYLAAGTYELTYILNLSQPGEYQVLPARAWQFYFPEVQGNSAGAVFSILP
jgi:uncharacterized protein YfaS (alpha-2-macroglobulin family)